MSTQTLPLTLHGAARRWYAIFIPSLADLFFVCVLLWLFVLGAYGWQTLLQDGDVGTHVRIGDYIVASHTVPTRDFLSFSLPGKEWYAFEWLTEAIFSLLHRQAGLKGVVLFSGVTITATFTILLLHTLWRGANIVVALVLSLMAVNASTIHFHARPHIFTLLFVAMTMWLIDNDRRRRTRLVWVLIPATVIWTNLHGGFFIVFALLGLLVIGRVAESLLWSDAGDGKGDALRYSILGIGCAAASLINPYGVKLHLSIKDVLHSDTIRNGVQEFQSPSFRSESMFHFMILLFLALAVSGFLVKKHRLTEGLWIWFWAYNALISVRHAPLFMIVAAPIVASEITSWWNEWVAWQPRRSMARTLDEITTQFQTNAVRISIWIPATVLALALSQSSNWPENFLEGSFPIGIIEKHAGELASARVYTSDKWAGYLIYRNYPRQQVFFDDRHQYYSEAIIQDYIKLAGGNPQWRDLLERYRFTLVLCAADSPLASLMKTHAAWQTVEDDGKTVLFRLSHAGT